MIGFELTLSINCFLLLTFSQTTSLILDHLLHSTATANRLSRELSTENSFLLRLPVLILTTFVSFLSPFKILCWNLASPHDRSRICGNRLHSHSRRFRIQRVFELRRSSLGNRRSYRRIIDLHLSHLLLPKLTHKCMYVALVFLHLLLYLQNEKGR